MKSRNQLPLKNGVTKSSQKSHGNRGKRAVIVRISTTLVSVGSNALEGCCRTNGEPGQAQITLPESANENCLVSVNSSYKEMGPKLHNIPIEIEWGYISQ